MSYHLEIKEEARMDILHASAWYADKGSGLNVKFISKIELLITSIIRNPKTYKKVYKTFRQASLRKFPYVLLFEHTGENVIVYSVFHTSQHPAKKIKRLK